MSTADPIPGESPRPDTLGLSVYAMAAALLLGLLIVRGYLPRLESRPSELVAAKLDINTADVAELDQLPGIGPARAEAIVKHRVHSGPLSSPAELDRIPGIGPNTAERIRPFLTAPSETTLEPVTLARKSPPSSRANKIQPGDPAINVNTASEAELMRLPGVGGVLAGRIVQARPFISVDDLRRVKGIGVKTLENLRLFVKTG